MKTATDRQDAVRFWGLGALAVLLSAGAAVGYLHSMGYGIAAGALTGLRGREGDVAFAQRWSLFWFVASACSLALSGLAAAVTTPLDEETPVAQLIARMIVASTISFVLAVIIGVSSVSIMMSAHHSVVR